MHVQVAQENRVARDFKDHCVPLIGIVSLLKRVATHSDAVECLDEHWLWLAASPEPRKLGFCSVARHSSTRGRSNKISSSTLGKLVLHLTSRMPSSGTLDFFSSFPTTCKDLVHREYGTTGR